MKTERHISGNLFRLGALGLSAFALAACMDQPISAPVHPEYYAASPQAQTDLNFQAGSSRLASGEVSKVRRFLAGQGLKPSDDIIVDVPSSGSPVVDNQRMKAARNAVGSVPARVRLSGGRGYSSSELSPDAGFVQVIRYDRLAVDCKWNGLTEFDQFYRAPIPPIGCANAKNLANMVADNRDLVAPRVLQPMDAASSVSSLERYQSGTTKPPPFSSNTSDGGQ
jgi:pilus biogenesis lipoprotein CpaD